MWCKIINRNNFGTSSKRKHLRTVHRMMIDLNTDEKEAEDLPNSEKFKNEAFKKLFESSDQKFKDKINELITLLVVMDGQPFSIVEHKGFRLLINTLRPTYNLPHRTSISSIFLPKLYEKIVKYTKTKLDKVSYISFTSDGWKDDCKNSYISFTAHYINENYEPQSLLLKMDNFTESKTFDNLFNLLNHIMKD